jgi:hypothetical protein
MSSQRLKKRARAESDDEFEGVSTQQTQSTSTQAGGREINTNWDQEVSTLLSDDKMLIY